MKKPRNWTGYAALMLVAIAGFSTGAYLASRYVSPCVCIFGQQSQVN